MGLFAKTNPTATRESVKRQAVIWGAISVVATFAYCLWKLPTFDAWPMLLPLAGLLGAALGALMEWQLDDGIEIYWVVREVEDEFSIKIADWEAIDTVDDLYRFTLASLHEKVSVAVDTEAVWQRLKALLAQQLGLKPEQITPAARFYIDLKI
jgi:acyl carrier protein